MQLFKPGETCIKTAKYIEVVQLGNVNYINGKTHVISLEIDEQFPPTRTSGLYWKEY